MKPQHVPQQLLLSIVILFVVIFTLTASARCDHTPCVAEPIVARVGNHAVAVESGYSLLCGSASCIVESLTHAEAQNGADQEFKSLLSSSSERKGFGDGDGNTYDSSGEDDDGCRTQSVTRFYLGQHTPNGIVSESEWKTFLDEVVAFFFSDGFTLLDASGHWRSRDTGVMLREPSKVLEVVGGSWGDLHMKEAVTDIVEDYKRRFQQEAVLVTTQQGVRVCFL